MVSATQQNGTMKIKKYIKLNKACNYQIKPIICIIIKNCYSTLKINCVLILILCVCVYCRPLMIFVQRMSYVAFSVHDGTVIKGSFHIVKC